ncbi:MAG: family 20 glycosylhydrolase [Candidatus Marinimicrobia bacterium]|nr:family 20 glycosylhydrolase [Candidatus Neomarinimicrobiota bacterium]
MIQILRIGILLISISLMSCQPPNQQKEVKPSLLSIIPKPNSIQLIDGQFDLIRLRGIHLQHGSEAEHNVLPLFQELLSPIKDLQFTGDFLGAYKIFIDLDENHNVPEEGYILTVGENQSVFLDANSPAGLFYGFQTFRQLCPPELEKGEIPANTSIPNCKIVDAPSFKWRGMHLDVGRHYFPVSFIKKYIDYLALHKMNTFHWHLTEDQGWRIEIKKYPRLTEVGAYRDETLIGHIGDRPVQFDGTRYGGFYTQEQIKDIVAYAQERFITVVPEIELPGHSVAALASYPHLACNDKGFEVKKMWGISENIYCAGNDSVFTFLEGVLTEVMNLFPSKYIHIGGDEAPKKNWKLCPKCQNRIKQENLKDEHELQSYFIKRIEKFVNSHGRNIIGWDEILEGGLAPNAAVMSWRGTKGGIEAAKQKHPVVMSPTTYCYFDYYQHEPDQEPLAIGGLLPVEKVYEYDPIPNELTLEEAKYILGVQGNVWTEYMPTGDHVEYMLFPRMSALSEVAWTFKAHRNFDDFHHRLSDFYYRLDALGVHYRHPTIRGFEANNVFIGSTMITIQKPRPYLNIHYTLNGEDPTTKSPIYHEPFTIHESAMLKAAEILPDGSVGKIYKGQFIKQSPQESKVLLNPKPGVKYKYYTSENKIYATVEIDDLPEISSGFIPSISLFEDEYPIIFGYTFSGYIQVPKDGLYTFYTLSNDGSTLSINDILLVDNDNPHGAEERYGEIVLRAGFHKIDVKYFQQGGGKTLHIYLKGPGIEKHEIESHRYFY